MENYWSQVTRLVCTRARSWLCRIHVTLDAVFYRGIHFTLTSVLEHTFTQYKHQQPAIKATAYIKAYTTFSNSRYLYCHSHQQAVNVRT